MKRLALLPGFLVATLLAPSAVDGGEATVLGDTVDLTHAFDATTIYWPTEDGFVLEGSGGVTDSGYYYESHRMRLAEHGGTHLDAPIHFHEGGQHAAEVPLDRLIGNAVVVDVAAASAADRDLAIGVDAIDAFEAQHGKIAAGSLVLFRTGYAAHWPDREAYLGTALRGAEGVAALHFPGLSDAGARRLVEREVGAVGIDTASIDPGQSTDFLAHRVLAAEDIPIFENLASLAPLPPTGAVVVALPMKIARGSGGPLRVIAILPAP